MSDESNVSVDENRQASGSRETETKGRSESLAWLHEMFGSTKELDSKKKECTEQDKKRKAEGNLSDTSAEGVGRSSKRTSVDKGRK